jgi:hypothetical protein
MLNSKQSSLVFAAFSLIACGGDDKPANTGGPGGQACPPGQYFDGQICQPMQGAAPAATPAPGAPGAAPAPAPAPGAPAPIVTAQAGPTATPLDPAAAAAATQAINLLAPQSAPGAKAVGSAIAGQFQQGQSLEGQVQMQPNKCYTLIGVGLPPVQNLDIQLAPFVAMPGLPAMVLAADQTVGPNATIGEKATCYKSGPIAVPMKVIVTVSQGSGVAAVQVYEK